MARHEDAFLVNLWFESDEHEEPRRIALRGSAHAVIRPSKAALRPHDLDAVSRCFVHAIAEGAAAVLLSRVEHHPHRHRVDDRRTSTDVIAVRIVCGILRTRWTALGCRARHLALDENAFSRL
jgi:hypothetical protein